MRKLRRGSPDAGFPLGSEAALPHRRYSLMRCVLRRGLTGRRAGSGRNSNPKDSQGRCWTIRGTRSESWEEIVIRITVMLVEDNRVMRDALTYVVGQDSGLRLVATAADAEEAITAGRCTQPQVVVMDIRLPGRDGIDATRELCRALPDVRVVILSVCCTRTLVRAAFGAGACGYLVKDGSHRRLVDDPLGR